ncbi:MAG: hypothetical protein ACOX7F_01205 [Eubacteriales bacterium]|jgi:hypothetical protein
MDTRERNAVWLGRMAMALMLVVGLVTLPGRLWRGEIYLAVLSAGSCAAVALPWVIRRVLQRRSSAQLEAALCWFVLLSFSGGMALQAYHWLPLYDKFTHGLSGVIFALVGLVLYYMARPGQKRQGEDWLQAALFSFCFAMTTAGVWELYEYFLSFVMDTDPQNVLTTGVGDTMQDMLACLIGAVVLQPGIRRWYRTGNGGLLLGAMEHLLKEEREDDAHS